MKFRNYFILLIFGVSGCSAFSSWRIVETEENLPWTKAEFRAKEFHKEVFCLMCPTGNSYYEKIVDEEYRSFGNPNSIIFDQLERLGKTKTVSTWPNTNSWYNSEKGPRRYAPYRIYLVSLSPAILIFAYEESEKYLFYLDLEIEVAESDRDNIVENLVSLNTVFPMASKYLWYSPVLKKEPQEFELVGGEATIRIGKDKLVLAEVNENIEVYRVARGVK